MSLCLSFCPGTPFLMSGIWMKVMLVPRFWAPFFFLFSAEKTQSAVGSKALFLPVIDSEEAEDDGNKFLSVSACELDGFPIRVQSEIALEAASYKCTHMLMCIGVAT